MFTKEIESPSFLMDSERLKIKKRPAKFKKADISCVKAIAQAAINVELFTIPLYMTALYSVQGLHQINSEGSDLYEGRWWPGSGPQSGEVKSGATEIKEVKGLTANERVFNNVYSVFIEEMLHLQLASNMASKIGVSPSFTSEALQNDKYGWKCYDPATNRQTIPHILSLKDCNPTLEGVNPKLKKFFEEHYPGKTLQDIAVKVGAMDAAQTLLFLVIEETEEDAHKLIQRKYWDPNDPHFEPVDGDRPRYFEHAPFDWWKPSYSENDLPLFGSIGHMYLSYWNYLEIEYDDNTSLLGELLEQAGTERIQNDRFNSPPPDQYPGIDAVLVANEIEKLKLELINNINAITDQGEGGGVVGGIRNVWKEQPWAKQLEESGLLTAVRNKFQPSAKALMILYPGYNDRGEPDGMSGNAYARISNKAYDHFEIFAHCLELIVQNQDKAKGADRYVTWDIWHQENDSNPWTKEMLNPKDTPSKYDLPSAEKVAAALNQLGAKDKRESTHKTFSLSAVGTLKGLTTSLDRYWNEEGSEFPSPAMAGSGDRVSICWAATGMVPDLVTGIESAKESLLYNACQAMNYMERIEDPSKKVDPNSMPDVVTYHSCKGSNDCRTQGGCGFVQSDSGGGNCSTRVALQQPAVKAGCGAPDIKSAPSNNKCATYGGCAVPISASQLFPEQTEQSPMMKIYQFEQNKDKDGFHSVPTDKVLRFAKGESVHDVAWKAYWLSFGNEQGYIKVDEVEKVGDTEVITASVEEVPEPTAIRLALPPST